jgi:hypothetical protein
MKNPLVMDLYSAKPWTPDFAREQIGALSNFEDGLVRPDTCDTAEPVRDRFDPADIEEPVRWLSIPGIAFVFRKGKPTRVAGEINNRLRRELWTIDENRKRIPLKPKFPPPLFTCRWMVWFDGAWSRKVGYTKLKAFAVEMFRASHAQFGFLTTEEDHKAKNFLVTRQGELTHERFVGTDPEHGIPGLYWVTLFGDELTEWLGREKLGAGPGNVEPLAGNGTLLQFGGSPETCRSPEVLAQQRHMIERIGDERFFDIKSPGRPLESPYPGGPLREQLRHVTIPL